MRPLILNLQRSGFFDAGELARSMKQIFKRVQKRLFKQINKLLVRFSGAVIKPASVLGRKIFEQENIQRIFGIVVVSSVFGLANLPGSFAGVQTFFDTNFARVENTLEISTKTSLRLPVESFSITQNYHLFHPGIDLATAKGSPVFSIMDGVVEKIGHDRWAFGNHVIVDHGTGLKSVYAHLAKIEVKEGERVTQESILGLVGSTGWSTGPHLHLQIEQESRWVNPRAFFEGYFGQRLAGTR